MRLKIKKKKRKVCRRSTAGEKQLDYSLNGARGEADMMKKAYL